MTDRLADGLERVSRLVTNREAVTCGGEGCSNEFVPWRERGTQEYCSDTCRHKAAGQRHQQQLALEVADLIGRSPERPLLVTLAGLDRQALMALRDGLAAAMAPRMFR